MKNLAGIREQFPVLNQQVHGYQLAYLDSAATAQKPLSVIEAESRFYELDNAGVNRGTHELAVRSTLAFEQARRQVADLVGANNADNQQEIVITSGATASFNLFANAVGNASAGFGGVNAQQFALKPGDEVVISEAEHHSVLLPFQELCARTGAKLRWFGLDDDGRIQTEKAGEVITERTKIVAITHISNVTGYITDIPPIVKRAHEVGAVVVLDACQSVPHIPIDFHQLDVDFAAWSAHKMYGPTGVGFLYGKRQLLEALPPANFGGSMVELAYIDRPAQYKLPPERFEAGTQPVAQLVAAGVAAKWLSDIGMDTVVHHEQLLTSELLKIQHLEGIRILGPQGVNNRIGTVSFELEGVHPHDVGQFLDSRGIAIRVGHHCAQPVHRHFGVFGSNRASIGIYNTLDDVSRLKEALTEASSFFGF